MGNNQKGENEMKNAQFNYANQKWVVAEVKDHTDTFKAQLGWTHFAGVTRPNGKKMYWANLLVVDGQIVDSMVVL
jgi:hypothetical protein